MCDAYLDLIEYEQPVCIFPMACAGSTGPGSLFSNIVLGNAEAISSLVLFQMAKPGCPLIYGDASGSTNFPPVVFSKAPLKWFYKLLPGVKWLAFIGLADRNSCDQWVALGRPDIYDKAREKV